MHYDISCDILYAASPADDATSMA